MSTAVPLSGAEQVLVAQVPMAGDRWSQVHFNVDVTERFFRVTEGEEKRVRLERVDRQGNVIAEYDRPLVISPINRNLKIEFDFHPVRDYPAEGRPILLVLELSIRHFRYLLLLPGEGGYEEMLVLNQSFPSIGQGVPRIISYLDEVELRWPSCPLRAS
jgi:hypothetical protein